MNNMVVLQKVDGKLYCRQITLKGINAIDNDVFSDKVFENQGYWEDGGTILLEELEEILDREV